MRSNYDGSNQNGERGSGTDWFEDAFNVNNEGVNSPKTNNTEVHTKGNNNYTSTSTNAYISYQGSQNRGIGTNSPNSNIYNTSQGNTGNNSNINQYGNAQNPYSEAQNNPKAGYQSNQTSQVNSFSPYQEVKMSQNNGRQYDTNNLDVGNLIMHDKLVKAYIEIESELSVSRQEEMNRREELARQQNFNDNYHNPNEVNPNTNDTSQKKGLSKGVIVGIVLGSVAVVVVVIVLVFVLLGNNKDTDVKLPSSSVVVDSSLKGIQSKIDVLYTDSLKTDIKDGYTVSDLDALRSELEKYANTADCSVLESELDTIEMYLDDRKTVDVYADLNYNIEPESVATDCETVKGNLENYTVAGLKSTISGMVTEIISDRDAYLAVKDELSSINDASTFNEALYKEKINGIKHTVNKQELLSMYNDLCSDKDTALSKESTKATEDKGTKDESKDDTKKEEPTKATKSTESSKEKETTPPTESSSKVSESKKEAPTEEVTEVATEEETVQKRDVISEIISGFEEE